MSFVWLGSGSYDRFVTEAESAEQRRVRLFIRQSEWERVRKPDDPEGSESRGLMDARSHTNSHSYTSDQNNLTRISLNSAYGI